VYQRQQFAPRTLHGVTYVCKQVIQQGQGAVGSANDLGDSSEFNH